MERKSGSIGLLAISTLLIADTLSSGKKLDWGPQEFFVELPGRRVFIHPCSNVIPVDANLPGGSVRGFTLTEFPETTFFYPVDRDGRGMDEVQRAQDYARQNKLILQGDNDFQIETHDIIPTGQLICIDANGWRVIYDAKAQKNK